MDSHKEVGTHKEVSMCLSYSPAINDSLLLCVTLDLRARSLCVLTA